MVMRKDDPSKIWFLTAVISKEVAKERGYDHSLNHRTFGYYKGFHAAYQAVKENRCNMHECLYEFLVMERIEAGVHGEMKEEEWFKWSGKRWIPCKKPLEYRGIINWALG
jgi:hypothetical protein